MTYTGCFRVWTTLLAAVLAVILLSAAAPTNGAGAQEAGCRGQVVLDAGHGGQTQGRKTKRTTSRRRTRPSTSPDA